MLKLFCLQPDLRFFLLSPVCPESPFFFFIFGTYKSYSNANNIAIKNSKTVLILINTWSSKNTNRAESSLYLVHVPVTEFFHMKSSLRLCSFMYFVVVSTQGCGSYYLTVGKHSVLHEPYRECAATRVKDNFNQALAVIFILHLFQYIAQALNWGNEICLAIPSRRISVPDPNAQY